MGVRAYDAEYAAQPLSLAEKQIDDVPVEELGTLVAYSSVDDAYDARSARVSATGG